jgi:hypothetical protein
MRNIYKILVRISEGNMPLGRPKCNGKGSICFGHKEKYYDRKWINLAQDKVQWRAAMIRAMNLLLL